MKLTRFAKFAWLNVIYNIGVIVWGAYVRATGSGAGCGAHWPSCQGEVIPRMQQLETLIEFSHRATSGLALILVLILMVWAFRIYPKGNPARFGASLSVTFMLTEALLGASLVLFQWVAYNESVARVYAVSAHLINTFLLLAALTLTAWWASGGKAIRLKPARPMSWGVGLGMLAVVVLGVSGAITALGDTLFPAGSLAEGIAQDFEATAHFLVRLRVYHPLIAIGSGVYLLTLARYIIENPPSAQIKKMGRLLLIIFLTQLLIGGINLLLLVPIWTQLLHLFVADSVWIVLVLLYALIQQSPKEANYTAQHQHHKLPLEL